MITFTDELENIIDAPAPWQLRLTNALATICVLALIFTASVSSINIVVKAIGYISADAPTIVLQPMERSVLIKLNVKAGDIVVKGQVLAMLDASFNEAERLSLLTQERALRATVLRIDAELGDALFDGNPAQPEIALQATLYEQHKSLHISHLKAMDEDIGRDIADSKILQSEVDLLIRELSTVRNIEAIRSALLATQTGSRLSLLDAQAVSVRTERDYQATLGRLTDLQHDTGVKLAAREAYLSQWRGALLEEKARNRNEQARIEEALTKAERMHDLVQIVAPEDAVVLEVARRSVGSVMREAEPLMTLLPTHVPLIADVRIASADVGLLHEGDPVILKIDAFPFQRHGSLRGHLRAISRQLIASESMNGSEAMRPGADSSHHAQITVDDDPTATFKFIPGMTLTAEFNVGTRSVIAYFLSPITKGLSESLNEP